MEIAEYVVPAKERLRSDPFPHFVVPNALPPELAEEILAWFEESAIWQLHAASFFEQYELDLTRCSPPAACARLFDRGQLAAVARRYAKVFDADMTGRVQVTAHRLLAGQTIGIHTDEPKGDRETHRLIIQLNRGWDASSGGELVLLRSDDAGSIHTVIRPIHNTSIGFEMSNRSFHAVARVNRGVRYTVIFSLWANRSAKVSDLAHVELGNKSAALNFLESKGAAERPHSRGVLLDHLKGVERLLDRWGYPPHVRYAGLFHSVYGTEGFPSPTTRDRDMVKSIIGPEAERLVDWFACLERRSLVKSVASGRACLRSRGGDSLPAQWTDICHLVAIDVANIAELLPRLADDTAMIADDRNWYRQVRDLLNNAARTHLDTLFDRLADGGNAGDSAMAEAALRSFLDEAGAGRVVHSQGSLLQHLEGMRDLLANWAAPPRLAIAALAVGLYSWRAHPNLANRALIRTVIGDSVERLIYLHAAIAREEIVTAAAALAADPSRPGLDVPKFDGTAEWVTREELRDLIWLDAADLVERASRVPASAPFPDTFKPWLPAEADLSAVTRALP
jgi:Rps23 Pro-64 3,4-dihydroxylase Tpa1-like proline 4-hydroxylase